MNSVEAYTIQSSEISRQIFRLQQAKNAMSAVSKRKTEDAYGHF